MAQKVCEGCKTPLPEPDAGQLPKVVQLSQDAKRTVRVRCPKCGQINEVPVK